MTLLPLEAQRIKYVPEDLLKHLPEYDLPGQCAHPECNKAREPGGGHHVVRRSHTQGKGPQVWIAFDGKPFPNLVGLCSKHHRLVTENRARIVFDGSRFCWSELRGESAAPLFPVPLIEAGPPSSSPTSETTLTATAQGASLDEREEEEDSQLRDGRESTSRSPASEGDSPTAAAVDGASYELSDAPAPSENSLSPETSGVGAAAFGDVPLAPGTPCPECGRKLPKPKAELEPTRVKVTFSIKVPKDAREDGYELLRSLLKQCQEELGREGQPGYFTLVEVMYGWLTSAKERAVA